MEKSKMENYKFIIMKKLILIIAIVVIGMTIKAQDTVRTNFDFSIELLTDTVYRGNGNKVTHKVSVLPVQFTPNKVAFNFIIETYNVTNPDTAMYVGKRTEQAVLTDKELNANVSGHKVWYWLEFLYGDTKPPIPCEQIITTLGELVYYYKVEGGN